MSSSPSKEFRRKKLRSPLAIYLANPDERLSRVERAMILNPLHPAWYETALGLACYRSAAYEDSAAI